MEVAEVPDELQQVDDLLEKGELERAQILCKALLQQHPTSAAAHEKMGDVMYQRELWEDAVAWYDLGRQLSDSPRVEEKLAEARRRVREARKGPEPVLVYDTGQRRTIWLGIGVAVLALLVVLAVLGAIVGRHPIEEQQAAPREIARGPSAPLRSPALSAPSPTRGVAAAPSSAAAGVPQAPQAQEIPSQHWSAQEGPQRAPRRAISTRAEAARQQQLTEPLTDHDNSVIDAVSSLTWGDDRPMTGQVSAMVDPYTGYAIVRATIPPSLPTAGLMERVIAQAYRIALATIHADEVINAVTVQIVRVTDQGERVLAFRGNTTRAVLDQYRGPNTPDFNALRTNVFGTVWWNPQSEAELPAATEGGQAASPPGG